MCLGHYGKGDLSAWEGAKVIQLERNFSWGPAKKKVRGKKKNQEKKTETALEVQRDGSPEMVEGKKKKGMAKLGGLECFLQSYEVVLRGCGGKFAKQRRRTRSNAN